MELREIIAEKIAKSGENVTNMVTELLVSKEVEKRSNSIIQALSILDKEEKELSKISKPDVAEILDVDGKVQQPAGYSKSKLEQIKKTAEKVEKLKSSINECLNNNTKESYSKLENLTKNAGGNKTESSGDNS